MRIIGLIGGMSWESSAEYYRMINEFVKEKLGGLHSARCLMYSVDFAEIEELQHAGEWSQATDLMIDAAKRLEKGGADCVVICTNTMHKMADEVQLAIKIPLIHIADSTAEEIGSAGLKTVGLLGTKFIMEEDFYIRRLSKKFGLQVLIPDKPDREFVHGVIYDELCLGKINQASREGFKKIIDRLRKKGAEGIILGCTEIPLLIKESDLKLPIFDTAKIHAKAAVDFALEDENS